MGTVLFLCLGPLFAMIFITLIMWQFMVLLLRVSMPLFIFIMLIFLCSLLGGCTSEQHYKSDCQTATFNAAQCDFLWKKRQHTLGVSGPLIGGIVGINLP